MIKYFPSSYSSKLSFLQIVKRFNHVQGGRTQPIASQDDDMIAKPRSLRSIPKDEEESIRAILNQPLTAKESQLDQELTKFMDDFKYLRNRVSSKKEQKTIKDAGKFTTSSTLSVPFPFLKSITDNNTPYSPQEIYLRQLNHAKTCGHLGANIDNVYNPQKDVSHPPSIEETTINKLMAANVHLGQSTSLYRASTQRFIYGQYKGLHIIDLNQTLQYLKRACSVVEGIVAEGGLVLLLGTKPQWKIGLQLAAKRMNGYFISTRWIPGTLTNPTELSRIWEKQELDQFDKPTGRTLTSDEMSCIIKPDLLIVLNPTENRNALYEAMKTRIPTIGIIDTDSEPSLVTYPIPGNDDSNRSVNLLLSILSKAGERGLNKRPIQTKKTPVSR